MSLARVYTTKGPVRKDGLTCGKCGTAIVKGQDRRRTFAVGFRGWEQTRCMRPECTPTRAELESSAVADVYSAMDDIDYASLGTTDDFTEARDSVVSAIEDVASNYESNEMYEINEVLQERVDILQSAASDLEQWEPGESEPNEDDPESWGDEYASFEDAHDAWLEETREALESAIQEVELP